MAEVVAAFAVPIRKTSALERHAPIHIPSLDGIRAASFLLVFASHAGLDFVVPGGFGVTVFFFLSGFLITTLMRVEADRTHDVSLRDFYLRRALRILPPFYVVLVVATALAQCGFLRGSLQPMAVAAQWLHYSNYWIAAHGGSGIAAGTGVYWSLAVEEHFYLIFPTIFLMLRWRGLTGRHTALVFWGACAAVLLWRCVLIFLLHANVDRVSLCSDTRIDSIAFGCALAVWNNPVLDPDPPPLATLFRKRALCALGIGLLVVSFVVRAPVFRETLRYTVQGVGLTPIFIAAIRHPEWIVFRPLNWRPMRFLGKVSYSLYLVHHVVLSAFTEPTPAATLSRAVIAFVVSLSVAWAMYVLVEKPCAQLRRKLSVA